MILLYYLKFNVLLLIIIISVQKLTTPLTTPTCFYSNTNMDWAMKKGPTVSLSSPSTPAAPGASSSGCDDGSCLLGNDGRCVEKATYLLSALKKQLGLWRESFEKGYIVPSVLSGLAGEISSNKLRVAISDQRLSGGDADTTSKEGLHIRGTQTGIARHLSRTSTDLSIGHHVEQFDWSTADQAITRSLSLIMKLEKDKEETVRLLEEERGKVKEMRAKLDAKAAERLKILASIVQKGKKNYLAILLILYGIFYVFRT